MTGLVEHQRALLDLLKGRPRPDIVDPYLAQVAGSEGLGLLREIAVWWRVLSFEASCASLSRLLKKLGRFERGVQAFYLEENVSPYVGQAVEQFLSWIQRQQSDPLITPMARFELALIKARLGDVREFVIDWDRNPDLVFQALAPGHDLPPAERGRVYRLHVSRAIVGFMRCECLEFDPPDGPKLHAHN